MQPILHHIATVVQPALRNYLASEKARTDALSRDGSAAGAARQDVMLAPRQAVDLLRHLSDFVLRAGSH
jgi:hypothetical protein